MSFSSTASQIHHWTTDQIYEKLKQDAARLTPEHRFALCDQLLLRKQAIRFVEEHYEALFGRLKVRVLEYIDQYDYMFSKAALHLASRRLQELGRQENSWFYTLNNETFGPVNRIEIENILESKELDWIWKEGWKEWERADPLPFLSEPLYYQQEFPKSDSKARAASPHASGESSPTGSTSTTAGIFTLVGLPIWLIACFALPIHGAHSFSGWFAPLMVSLSMLVLTIPIGIGLLSKKLWALNFSLFTSAGVVAWFLAESLMGNLSAFWLFMGIYEIIILILALLGTSWSQKWST